jgi:hypothetical protein
MLVRVVGSKMWVGLVFDLLSDKLENWERQLKKPLPGAIVSDAKSYDMLSVHSLEITHVTVDMGPWPLRAVQIHMWRP